MKPSASLYRRCNLLSRPRSRQTDAVVNMAYTESSWHPQYRPYSSKRVVDLRSDTVTSPTREMLECALTAQTGDDVMGEDPTVKELEGYMADLCGKDDALYLPTGTMANLVALLAHCHGRASEIILGSSSHICLYEGGNTANLGGVHSRQLAENEDDATLDHDAILDAICSDDDDHYAKTSLICLENTHNMLGGIVLDQEYVQATVRLAHQFQIPVHVDGARIFNAAVASNLPMRDLCQGVDSVSICLSKGLGAPLGTVLVGAKEFIRLAKRARKRCGGGMRQAGVVASMGLYAVQNNVERLKDDHKRAKRIAEDLKGYGFMLPRNGQIDTNILYFGLPEGSLVSKEELCPLLESKFGVKMGGGYSKGGSLFRVVTHMGIDDEDADRATEAIVKLCLG